MGRSGHSVAWWMLVERAWTRKIGCSSHLTIIYVMTPALIHILLVLYKACMDFSSTHPILPHIIPTLILWYTYERGRSPPCAFHCCRILLIYLLVWTWRELRWTIYDIRVVTPWHAHFPSFFFSLLP